MTALLLLAVTSCHDPEYVDPTVKRQGITSITAYFTSGPYNNMEMVKYDVADPSASEFVVPIPWFYPEDSNNETTDYMSKVRLKIEIANNCIITPPVTVLDMNKANYFTFTEPDGTQRQISIRGERTKSNKCELMTFDLKHPELSGVVDNDAGTVSIISSTDIKDALADVTMSAHATITPDPSKVAFDVTSPATAEFTVVAHNGVDKKTYKVVRAVLDKVDTGIREGSQRDLFKTDLSLLGVTDANAIHPTLAVVGSNLVVNFGDGSKPIYLNKITGSKKGEINLGDADPSGSVASDCYGNMLICNYAPSGSTFKVYKTSSVEEAPTLYFSMPNSLGLGLGSRVHIQGNLNGDAIISVTCEGNYAQHFVRAIVKDGVVGKPELVTVNTPQWAGRDGNAKVVAKSTNVNDGYFVGYYAGGADLFYYVGADNNPVSYIEPIGDGTSWGKNNNSCDTRYFNGASYTALLSQGYWPDWGMPGILSIFSTTSTANFSGTMDATKALYYTTTIPDYTSIPYAGDGRTGDVVMAPSVDGYKLNLYYISNTHLGIGGMEFDCIKK